MRHETKTVRVGENVGPVDWDHKIAQDTSQIWRDAEKNPADFLFNGRTILEICMYDGWPFWTPRPAVHFIGPIGGEWSFFDSYGVYDNSITRAP